jgi:membrane-associated phospholipid phosphatase
LTSPPHPNAANLWEVTLHGRSRSHSLLLLIFLSFLSPQAGLTQQAQVAGQSPERRLPHDFLQDQKAIWTSPAHIRKRDLKWVLPFVVATTGLVITDLHNSQMLGGGDNDDLSVSHAVSNAGFGIMAGGFAASYVVGHLRYDNRAVETGVLGAEAMADSALVDNLIKFGTNRRRPDAPGADGDFWSGGKSFPSNHSIMTWAAATVIAERYPDRRLLKWSAYSLATAVSFTRGTGKNHYPSDAFVGAVFGYLIGRYVARHHTGP